MAEAAQQTATQGAPESTPPAATTPAAAPVAATAVAQGSGSYDELARGIFDGDEPDATPPGPEPKAEEKPDTAAAAQQKEEAKPEEPAAPVETPQEPAKVETAVDEHTASGLALIARQERRLLELKQRVKAEAEEVARVKAAAQMFGKDPMAAIQALGLDPLKVYGSLTESFTGTGARTNGADHDAKEKPAEAATSEVAELKKTVEHLTTMITQQQQQAMVSKWESDVLSKLSTGKYPHLNRLGSEDALKWVGNAFVEHANDTGSPPALDSFLPLVEDEIAKLATRLSGQAQPNPPGTNGSTTPAPTLASTEPVAQPPERTGKGTAPSTLTNELTASPSNPKPWNREDAFVDAVRALKEGGW